VVVDDKAGDIFLGVVYEASITRAYMQHSEELQREEHGTG
jgi:CIC family chloride channel protein